jgi:prolyl-tRNA synthetase
VDNWVAATPDLVSGANEVGAHFLHVNCGRDFTADVVEDISAAAAGDPCPKCARPLAGTRMLPFGTEEAPSCENVLFAAARKHRDTAGLILPPSLAPFDAHLILLTDRDRHAADAATALHADMQASGTSVLLDDRPVSAGVKFKDADLIGLPFRVVIGGRSLQHGMVELRRRGSPDTREVKLRDAVPTLKTLLSI